MFGQEQLVRAHERDIGWLVGSGSSAGHGLSMEKVLYFEQGFVLCGVVYMEQCVGSFQGSKKMTRDELSPSMLTNSFPLSDGPWWRP